VVSNHGVFFELKTPHFPNKAHMVYTELPVKNLFNRLSRLKKNSTLLQSSTA
jgi:hypothetical protein